MRVASAQTVFVASVLGLLTFLAAPMVTGAQEATPGAAAAAVTCDVAPRSVAEILALLSPTPQQGGEIPPLPRGKPADATITAEIAAAVQQIEACVNTGDLLRFYALFSDGWFERLPKGDDVVAEITALESATQTPFPEGHRAFFIGPWHVEVLEDGRIAVAVAWFASEDNPCPAPERTKMLLFVNDNGRWLVDETVDSPFYNLPAVVGPPPTAMLDRWAISCDE